MKRTLDTVIGIARQNNSGGFFIDNVEGNLIEEVTK